MSPSTNVQLLKERINALLFVKIFHVNANNAKDTDIIYTPCAMQSLMGYALRPSFIDLAYSTAVKMAYQEINQHRRSLGSSLEIAQQHNLKFNFDRTPEQARIQELMDHIRKLEDTAGEKSSSRAEKSSPKVKKHVGRTKRVAVKVSSSKTAFRTPRALTPPPTLMKKLPLLFLRGKDPTQRGRPQPPLVLVLKNLKHRGLYLLRQRVLSRADLPNLPPTY